MRSLAFVAILAILALNADAFARPIPPHMTGALVLGATGLAVGLVVGHSLGRARQRVADTRKFYGSRTR